MEVVRRQPRIAQDLGYERTTPPAPDAQLLWLKLKNRIFGRRGSSGRASAAH